MQHTALTIKITGSLLAALSVMASACRTTETAAAAPPVQTETSKPPPLQLSNAAPSIDVLVDQFLHALEGKDFAALERLRVTQTEYLVFILPGSVEPGKPPQQYPPTPSAYYWGTMNTKSIYTLRSILAGYGGRHYTRKQIRFAKGTQEYAWYKAYKKLHLTLEDDQGQAVEIDTGSIAEVNGQFKFISFRAG
jgi:hypothetical protein